MNNPGQSLATRENGRQSHDVLGQSRPEMLMGVLETNPGQTLSTRENDRQFNIGNCQTGSEQMDEVKISDK